MQAYIVPATDETPAINLDSDSHLLQIIGVSLPENVQAFFKPIIKWIRTFLKSATQPVVVKIHLDYFNTATSKSLMEFFFLLHDFKVKGVDIKVIWLYYSDDEDLQDSGEDFASLVDVPFEFVALDPDL